MARSPGLFDESGVATFRIKFTFEVDREIVLDDQDYVCEVVAARAALHMASQMRLGWPALALYLGNEIATELRPFRWTSNAYIREPMHVEGMPKRLFEKVHHDLEIETATRIYKARYAMWLEFHSRRKRNPSLEIKPLYETDARPFRYDEKSPRCQRYAQVLESVRDELKGRRINVNPHRSRSRRKEMLVGRHGVNKKDRLRSNAWKKLEPKSIGARAKFLQYVRKVAEANGQYGPPNLRRMAATARVHQELNDVLENLTVRSTEDDEQQQQQQQPMDL